MNPSSNLLYSETVNIHSQKRQARRIADYLMTVLRIPDGTHLVLFFGTGLERNNREAIATWIEATLAERDADATEARLAELARDARLKIVEQMEQP